MKRVQTVEIELRDGSSTNAVTHALHLQHDAVQQAIAAFDHAGRLFGITLTWNGIRRTTGDAQVACEVLEGLLADLDPGPERLRSVGALWTRGQREPRVTLTLTQHEMESDPAGVLLLERTISNDPNRMGSGDMIADIRKTLEDHVMAHVDSEYIVMVDVPIQAESQPTTAMLHGLVSARSTVTALPAEVAGRPNVIEVHVRLREPDEQARLRIWRLGFMKVPGRSRIV